MRFPTRQQTALAPGVTGAARVDRRLPQALRRARPGDVVVTDARDLDRGQAEALVRRGVVAVVSTSPFISGRYANLGPELLAREGVALLEATGDDVLTAVKDGTTVRLDGDRLLLDEQVVVVGEGLTLDEVQRRMDLARGNLAAHLQALTHNATEHLRREQDLLLHGTGAPELRTAVKGRPVVLVVRAFDHEADLRRLRRFIREQRPVLVGVDGGTDALLAARLHPDVAVVGPTGLLGSEESAPVSDRALRTAGEVVVHADPADRLPGADRLDRLGVRAGRVRAGGTTEDVAMLVADHAGASLLVAVGTHATLDELLDSRREGMASTFVTRLRVGPRLVDARSVPALYAGRVRTWHLLLVLLAGLLALAAAVALTPTGEDWLSQLGDAVTSAADDLTATVRGLLP